MMQDTHNKDYVRESYRYPRTERVDQFLMQEIWPILVYWAEIVKEKIFLTNSIVIQEYQMNKLFLRSQNAN